MEDDDLKFGEMMAEILARSDVPQYAQGFLPARKLANVELFANCLHDANKSDGLVLKPDGFDDPIKADVNDMLSTRGQGSHDWKLSKKAYGGADRSGAEDASTGITCLKEAKRFRTFSGYRERYSSTIPLEDTPRDRSIVLIYGHRGKRSCADVPFAMALATRGD